MRTRRKRARSRRTECADCGDVGLDLKEVYVQRPLGRRRRSEWGIRASFERRQALVLCVTCYSRRALRTRVPECGRRAARSGGGAPQPCHA